MRYSISIILMFLLMFCFGCGSANENDWDSLNGESIQGNDMEAPQEGATETQNDNNAEEIEYVKVRTEHIYEEYTDRETGNSLVNMNYHVVSLETENNTLQQTVSNWMVKRQQDLEEDGLQLMMKAKSKQKETGNEDLRASLWHEITLHRVDECLISFVDRQYMYSIDDWNNDYRCVNFDVASGKNLLLHDLLVDKDGFRNAVITFCVEKLENTYTNTDVDEVAATQIYQSITAMGNWCLDASGFVFVYEDDELEYSNEGVLFVHVPYDIVADYMNPAYLWGEAYGIASLAYDQVGTIAVDGEAQEICVEMHYSEYDMEQPKLIYADTMVDMSQHMRTNNIYLVHHENWSYLLMAVDMASADYQTYFYPLLADGVGKVFAVDGGLDAANVRTDSFDLAMWVDVFGTYQTYPEYFFVEEGTIAAYRVDYQIQHSNYERCELVTVRELPVMKGSTSMMLPIGSRLRISSTDNISWAKLLWLDTGEEVTVQFQREENYTLKINGVSEYAYFEELPYAG